MHKGLIVECIPLSDPWVTQKEIDYLAYAPVNTWYGNANRYHEQFEKPLLIT